MFLFFATASAEADVVEMASASSSVTAWKKHSANSLNISRVVDRISETRVTDSTKVESQRCLKTAPTRSCTPTDPRAGDADGGVRDVDFFADDLDDVELYDWLNHIHEYLRKRASKVGACLRNVGLLRGYF